MPGQYFPSYYYSFVATGVPEIDAILKEVADAGNFEMTAWNFIGVTARIQKAADEAAAKFKELNPPE